MREYCLNFTDTELNILERSAVVLKGTELAGVLAHTESCHSSATYPLPLPITSSGWLKLSVLLWTPTGVPCGFTSTKSPAAPLPATKF